VSVVTFFPLQYALQRLIFEKSPQNYPPFLSASLTNTCAQRFKKENLYSQKKSKKCKKIAFFFDMFVWKEKWRGCSSKKGELEGIMTANDGKFARDGR
jgi:hypothetical protein